MYEFHNILKPGEFAPISPSAEPFAIGSRIQEVNDLRFDGNSYKARGGTSVVHAAPTSGTFVGGAVIGTNVYVAVLVGAKVEVYVRPVTGGAWVQITASSGAYGDTRLSNPTRWISFAGFSWRGGTVVCIQDGITKPLWYANSGVAGSAVRSLELVAPNAWPVSFGAAAGLDVQGGGTPTNSGGGMTSSISTGWVFTPGTFTGGDWSQVLQGSAVFPSARQIWVVIKDASQEMLDLLSTKLQFVLMNGASTVITLPLESVRVLSHVPGVDVLAFDVQQETIGTVTGLRLLAASSGATSTTLKVVGVVASGHVPGSAEYKSSYTRDTGLIESAGTILINDGAATLPGMVTQTGFRTPISDDLYYQTTQKVKASPEALTGASGVNLYRKDSQDEDYFRIASLDASEYSGSWAYTSGFASKLSTYTDDTRSEAKDFKQVAPSAENAVTPIGMNFAAGGRHYVGASALVNQKGFTVSDKNYPWRFRSTNNAFDIREGFSVDLDADEEVVGFANSSSSNIGSPSVYGLTNKGVYAIIPVGARISSVGAASFGADYEGPIFFFTSDKQCGVLASRTQRISQNRVDSLITDVSRVSVATYNERIYFCIPGKILVYNTRRNEWESVDTIANLAMVAANAGKDTLYGFSSAGAFWKLEDTVATDFGGNVTGSIQTGLIANGQDSAWARRFMILGQFPNDVTTTRTTAEGVADTGTITGSADSPAWYYDVESEAHSVGVRLKLSAVNSTAFRLYQWDAELQAARTGPKA